MTYSDLSSAQIFLILSLFFTVLFYGISILVMLTVEELEKGLAVFATFVALFLAWFNGANIGEQLQETSLSHNEFYWYEGLAIGRLLTELLFLITWISIYYVKMKRNYQDFVRDDSVYIFEDNRLIPIIWVATIGTLALGSDLMSVILKGLDKHSLLNLLITILPFILGVTLACFCKKFILHFLSWMFLRSGLPEKAVTEGTKKWVPMSEDKLEMIQDYLKKRNIVLSVGLAIYILIPLFTTELLARPMKLFAIVVMLYSITFYKKAKELKEWHGEDEPDDVDKREVLYKAKI